VKKGSACVRRRKLKDLGAGQMRKKSTSNHEEGGKNPLPKGNKWRRLYREKERGFEKIQQKRATRKSIDVHSRSRSRTKNCREKGLGKKLVYFRKTSGRAGLRDVDRFTGTGEGRGM